MRKRLRFRCNPVLPEVYDDALSYYEVLGKITNAVNELGEEIDEGLVDFIREALPELISDVVYDAQTGTLEFTLIDDVTDEQILNDPIKRIAVNGLSRPVVDETARTTATAAQTTATAAQTTATAAQTIVDRLKKASWLYQKDVCFYGDSTIVVADNYASQIHSTSICKSVTIRGVSGNTLTTQGLPLINAATDLSSFDYVFVCYGINDWSGISRYRWCNAVRDAANRIINAGSEPVFVFPWVVYIPTLQSDGFINNYGCDMAGYVDGAIDMCEQLNVKYFNLCQISGVNRNNYTNWLTPSSNGYYLHENANLGAYISKAILTGNYNTGKCYAGRYTKPFKNLLPTNWALSGFDGTKTLIQGMPNRFRKGKPVTIIPGRVCEFHTITCGDKCRVTGYAYHADGTGYIDFSYIDNYNTEAGAQHLCRANSGSDFDFVFSPGTQGGSFKLCAQSSAGGNALIMDLAITGSDGTARLASTTPTEPALKISFNSNVTLAVGGYVTSEGDSVKMIPFAVRTAEAMSAGSNVNIGTLPFYPEHIIYGSCHIAGAVQLYRIDPTGVIQLYSITNNIPANVYIFFDENDVTPSPFFYSS